MEYALKRFGGNREKSAPVLEHLGISSRGYLLATVHRAENTDARERLAAIVQALESLEEPVVLPVHPRLRDALARLDFVPSGRVQMIDPVGYADMIALERHARAILTDSGGVQKEAYWLGVPCITMRVETEWIETVESGWNVLTGGD